jgi:hypothetical protein
MILGFSPPIVYLLDPRFMLYFPPLLVCLCVCAFEPAEAENMAFSSSHTNKYSMVELIFGFCRSYTCTLLGK